MTDRKIIMTAFSDTNQYIYNLPTAPRTVSNRHYLMASLRSLGKSRATRLLGVVVRRDSSAVPFDRLDISFIFNISTDLYH